MEELKMSYADKVFKENDKVFIYSNTDRKEIQLQHNAIDFDIKGIQLLFYIKKKNFLIVKTQFVLCV